MVNKLSLSIYESMKEDIISRRLVHGQKLSEDMLAKRYNASRTPIREALLLLDSDGLVVSTPNSGTVVKEFTLTDIANVFDTRIALESFASRIAAQKEISPEKLQELYDMDRSITEAYASGDITLSERLELDFHRSICLLSENTYLIDYHERLQRINSSILCIGIKSRISGENAIPFKNMVCNHTIMLKQIADGRPDMAEWASRMHVLEAKQYFLDFCRG